MAGWLADICGWIGLVSYTFFSVPQAIEAYKTGKTEGLSRGLILLLWLGSFGSFIYILPEVTSPLFYNFLISLLSATVLCRYHFFPRRS